jgi:hypothetical protein
MGWVFMLSTRGNRIQRQLSPSAQVAFTGLAVEETGSVIPTPGLIISGRVLDGVGSGVENVQIYRNYSAYPGEVLATTDADGSYASGFYPIPGDDMVTIWAEKPGLVFEPEFCAWRHVYGYKQKEVDFLAHTP